MRKKSFMDKRKLFASSSHLDLMKQIIKCYVSMALNATETWTMTKQTRNGQKSLRFQSTEEC